MQKTSFVLFVAFVVTFFVPQSGTGCHPLDDAAW